MIRLEKNLRRLRKEAGITQAQLADKLGVSFQAVSRWETGAAYPDIILLPELAEAFQVTVDTLLGITEAREKDIHAAVAELSAAYSPPMDTQAIISCLRELRRFHLTSPEFWPAVRSMPRVVLDSLDVRPELRLVFDAIWESDETNAFVKSSAVVWRARWEDEDRIERFLEVYSTSVDLSKEELLRSRAEYRQDWETLEPLRQRALMGHVSNLAASSTMWLPQGRPPTPKECFDLTSLQLRFLNSLSSPETGSSDALSCGKLDGWIGIRLYMGALRCGSLAALGRTEQAMAVLRELTELMEKAFSLPLPASIPCPGPWFSGEAWTVREIWRLCWWDDPEQEERSLDFCCMADDHNVLTPSWVVDGISDKGVMKIWGTHWMGPLRLHPDFPPLLERLEKLVVRRKIEENGGQQTGGEGEMRRQNVG